MAMDVSMVKFITATALAIILIKGHVCMLSKH